MYSEDMQVLFTIEWDSLFFLIATNSEKMKQIIEVNLFEGFICNDKTLHDWDYKEGELQELLDKEEKLKTTKPTIKKNGGNFGNNTRKKRTGANKGLPKAGLKFYD
ncbi:MAG: hypothetical protein EOO93_28855 [Pedobacter sp.]|nr:MAG: hypothetical protein EOO93_28855 [Pedobacter sp.]